MLLEEIPLHRKFLYLMIVSNVAKHKLRTVMIAHPEFRIEVHASKATRVPSSRRVKRRRQAESCQKHVRANRTMILFRIKPSCNRKGWRTGQGEEQHAKGLKCAEAGRHRSWYEEDSRRRAARNDAVTRELRRKRVKRVSSLPVGATVPRKEGRG